MRDKDLKDATNEALRDWVANVNDTHYLIGSVVGPHPFPTIVRDFQSVIGREAREQVKRKEAKCRTRSSPAWAGDRTRSVSSTRSLTMTWNSSVSEAAGKGLDTPETFRNPLCRGSRRAARHALVPLQDDNGQVLPTHSVAAGLDYPGVGPEHAMLKDSHRVAYHAVKDPECSTPSGTSRGRRGSSRRLNPPTRSRMCCKTGPVRQG